MLDAIERAGIRDAGGFRGDLCTQSAPQGTTIIASEIRDASLYRLGSTERDRAAQGRCPHGPERGLCIFDYESVHPFEDGNGRIGCALAEKTLAQSLGQPTLIAPAATILAKRKSNYEAVEAANKQNEIAARLACFARVSIEAQHRTTTLVEFLIDKGKLLDRLRGQLNQRQEKTLLRMLREGPDALVGGLSASKLCHYRGRIPGDRHWRPRRTGSAGSHGHAQTNAASARHSTAPRNACA
jgi:hypothetical protein